MCIRDRVETELSAEDEAALAAEPRRTLNRLLFPGPTKDYEDAVDAVSYTHLRAHETVLDLVCRLLLEKKKHKTTSNVPKRTLHTTS